MKNYKILYTSYWDLDIDKEDAKYYIDSKNIVTNNETGERVAFPSQISAIKWINKQTN
jgi:hypothetical protein